MAKPKSDLIVWANLDVTLPNTGKLNKSKPIKDLLDKGYDKGQKPAAEEFNYVLNMCTDWVRYMHDEKFPEFEKLIDKKISDFEKVVDKKLEDMNKKIDDLSDDVDKRLLEFSSFLVPIGGVMEWHSTTVPRGWLELNGQGFNIGQNPRLYAVLGKANVPDRRGLFARGWAHGSSVNDPDSGRALGSIQGDAMRNLTGGFVADVASDAAIGKVDGVFYDAGSSGYSADTGTVWNPEVRKFRFDASRQVPVATEFRPKNMAVMYIIKTDSADTVGTNVPTNIQVAPSEITERVGYTVKITAAVQPASLAGQYPVSFMSQNTGVATVDSSGNVRLTGPGTTRIVASISTGLNVNIVVNSYTVLTGLTLTNPGNIEVSATKGVVANKTPSNSNETIVWTSSNNSVASVSAEGMVTGLVTGNVTITARGAISGIQASVNITIIPSSALPALEDIQLGAQVRGRYQAPPGCVITFVDGGETMSYTEYKPLQKKVNGVWVTISG